MASGGGARRGWLRRNSGGEVVGGGGGSCSGGHRPSEMAGLPSVRCYVLECCCQHHRRRSRQISRHIDRQIIALQRASCPTRTAIASASRRSPGSAHRVDALQAVWPTSQFPHMVPHT